VKVTIPKKTIEVSFPQFVGRKIALRRKALGLTAESLAFNAGISKSFLSEVENGKRSISFRNMTKIAKQLDCSIDWFAKGWKE
jgi:transcriptional regulator with XRE-family HTH domain